MNKTSKNSCLLQYAGSPKGTSYDKYSQEVYNKGTAHRITTSTRLWLAKGNSLMFVALVPCFFQPHLQCAALIFRS